jgi:hypothetical protein
MVGFEARLIWPGTAGQEGSRGEHLARSLLELLRDLATSVHMSVAGVRSLTWLRRDSGK